METQTNTHPNTTHTTPFQELREAINNCSATPSEKIAILDALIKYIQKS
jgi:hypothetical protein